MYSIWICLNCTKKDANTVTRYHMAMEDIYGKCDDHPYDYVDIVMVRLPKLDKDLDEGNELIDMVGTVLSRTISVDKKKKKLRSKYGIPMTKEVERRDLDMCNLGEGIYLDGIEQGMKQGMEQGADRVNALNKKLIDSGRMDDLERAAKEPEYQQELFAEFQMS